MEFNSLPLSQSLLQVVKELGYLQMTPIQEQGLPLLLDGKDIIGQSQTGSGKTAAFSLPILQKIENKLGTQIGRLRQTQALILCPTRELCTQVAREIRKLGRRHSGLQVLILSGGQPLFPQLCALEKGVHIVVGTPGRVLDHLNRKKLDLSQISTLVLDEADRMLDMGFEEDMEKILLSVPEDRQTMLFSATFPKSIEALSRNYQKRPVRVTIEGAKHAAPAIKQLCFEAPEEQKLKAALWILQQNNVDNAIIFCNQKARVSELAKVLKGAGLSVECLHGDLEQSDRDRVMAKFRNLSTRILVATDVAARGIDIENLDLVLNFDFPLQPEIYVHRIGRTGRAGQRGLAITLYTPWEKSKLLRIESFTKTPIERKSIGNLDRLDMSKNTPVKDADMATLYIAAGRKEKMRPGDILGALTGEAGGLSASDVGKIEIHDRFSYVAVARDIAETALTRLRNGRIKGRKIRVEPVR